MPSTKSGPPATPKSPRGLPLSGTALCALLFASAAEAQTQTQTVYCGPGTKVESENGGGTGTIEEVGTQTPHVGWYRVSFSWSPRGEWYNPSTWRLYPSGTKKVCSPKPPAATPPQLELAPLSTPPEPRPGRRAPSAQPTDDNGFPTAGTPGTRPSTAPTVAGAGSLPPGRYTCSMDGAGQFPITIVDGSTYADRGGQSGKYVLSGVQITFESGSLRGQYSRILGQGKFGLSSSQTRTFYGVCNLKR